MPFRLSITLIYFNTFCVKEASNLSKNKPDLRYILSKGQLMLNRHDVFPPTYPLTNSGKQFQWLLILFFLFNKHKA